MTELGVAQARGLGALAGRETRRMFALWTQTLLPPVVTSLLFFAVFGGVLGDRLDRIDGVAYRDFVLPGLLVLAVAGQAFSNNSTSVFQARNEGYIEDVLTSPLEAWHLAVGYLLGGVLRGLIAAAVIALACLPFVGGVQDALTAAAALFLTAVIFGALGVVTGVWADTFDRHAFVANLVVTPLALIGGVFYPVDALDEPWATLTRFDPIYYLVDATRAGFTGYHESPVAVSLAAALAGAVVVLVALTALLRAGWRLKP